MPNSDLKQVFLYVKMISLYDERYDSCEDEMNYDGEAQELLRPNTNHLNKIRPSNGRGSLLLSDIWKRIIVLCIMRYSISFFRNTIVYASGQNYHFDERIEACNRCSIGVEMRHILSVCFGLSAAIIISYNLVHYVKRRTAFLSLLSLLSLITFPFYFVSAHWIIAGLIFLSSMLAECLFIIMFVYASEMVPTSVRGVAIGLVMCCSIIGELCSAIFSTYFLHVNFIISLSILHAVVVICLLVTYFFAIETKDISLD